MAVASVMVVAVVVVAAVLVLMPATLPPLVPVGTFVRMGVDQTAVTMDDAVKMFIAGLGHPRARLPTRWRDQSTEGHGSRVRLVPIA
jgi:hypothetical protein